MAPAPSAWNNRIVGYGEEPPENLLANPRNFRTHPAAQQDALSGVLAEVGVVQNIVVNRRSGYVVDGHARITLAMRSGQPSIPVTYVDLSEAEEALVLATLDPISAMAGADAAQLDALLREVSTGDAAVQQLLADLAEEHGVLDGLTDAAADDAYSRSVDSPVYEITGVRPPVADLVDETRTADLLIRIDAADAPEDVKRFLRLAAYRHLRFDYARVAEFYAHADAEVQALMERSALVIIDANQAIEYGFARLVGDLRDLAAEAEHASA